MAVEEVMHIPLLSFKAERLLCSPQEFSIEIPDAEADAIQTVKQGEFLNHDLVLVF